MQSYDTTSNDPPLKRCTKCGESKPATTEYFRLDKNRPDGLYVYCKPCSRLDGKRHREADPDRLAARKRRDYEKHRENILEKNRQRRAKNPEQIREQKRKAYRLRFDGDPEYREKLRAQGRQWYRSNPEKTSAYRKKTALAVRKRVREWEKVNPTRTITLRKSVQARRRARIFAAEGTHTADDIERQYKAQKGLCYWCGVEVGDTYHVDHVIPLSRGGSNGPENICIACGPCNLSKQGKLPTEWEGSRRLL